MGTKRGKYVVVHRDHNDKVNQVRKSFDPEGQAGGIAQQVPDHINFFAGDELCVEDDAGLAREGGQ